VQALPSVSEREERRAHLPQWLLKDEEKNGPGAFDWTYNGQPIKNSEGNQVLAKRQRVRVKLKVCKACNDELATRFEGTTKNILRELFATGGGVCLESQEARLVGEWFAKTMLLLAHPDRYHDNPVITRNSVRLPDDEVPGQHFYEWLINGQSPPEGLSIWLHRVDLTSQKRPSYCVPLPTVTADQQTMAFTEFQWGLHGIWAALVVHPGWPIIHPLAEQGFAAQVLPDPTDVVDLWPKAVAWPRRG
jgi:hypothetical protein